MFEEVKMVLCGTKKMMRIFSEARVPKERIKLLFCSKLHVRVVKFRDKRSRH